MCGITGIYGVEDKTLLKKMTDSITYRGPDDCGTYLDKTVSLGMRRLAIIDLKTGNQPIWDAKGEKLIFYNGEIYNYEELKKDLLKKGHKFYTETDTEVILHMYEQYGIQGLSQLDGMFAFALYDIKAKELVLARDRAGIKPLYYTFLGKKLIFGSEIKCILQDEDFPRELDKEALTSYLTYGTVMGDKTLFEGVKKLLPGQILKYDGENTNFKKLDIAWKAPVEDYSAKSLEKLFDTVVKDQMISHVPLGAFLSGGLDSSSIVGMMAKHSDDELDTFTVGFGQDSDEIYYAKVVAEHFGTKHHELIVSPDEVPKTIQKLVWHFDDLTWDSAAIPVYLVSKLARKYVTVALSGEGADELFGGYERFKPFSSAIPLVPKTVRWDIYRKFITMFDPATRKRICGSDGTYAEKILEKYEKAPGNSLENVMQFEYNEFLPNQLLNKADKAPMAASIEARVPYLDNNIIEFAKHVPLQEKVHGLEGKYILRKAVSNLVPKITKKRMKKGFGAKPIFWFRNKEMKEFTGNMLDKPHIEKSGLNYSGWKEIMANIERPKKAYQLWAMLLLEIWYRQFIEGEK